MNILLQITMVAAVTIYVVDLSGFTDSWRSALARALHISDAALRPLPPFDCGKCATWWACIIYTLCMGGFSLPVLAFIALLSFLSYPIGQMLVFIREGILTVINKLMEIL